MSAGVENERDIVERIHSTHSLRIAAPVRPLSLPLTPMTMITPPGLRSSVTLPGSSASRAESCQDVGTPRRLADAQREATNAFSPVCSPAPTLKRLVLLWAVMPVLTSVWAGQALDFDVVVYGATPAGVCAAIGAAREGSRVALVEPTALIGGVNSGGLSHSDSNQTVRSTLKGLFEEFHQRIEKDYSERNQKLNYSVAVKDSTRWTYEPQVAERVARAMLKEAGVREFIRAPLKTVNMEAKTIRRITTAGTKEFSAWVFIDATYEGDLMAAAGVPWTIGREARREFGESLAGKQYPKDPMPIAGYAADGKLLPLITGRTDDTQDAEGDQNVMTYSFRLCLTNHPANRLPFPPPAHYDANRFEAVRRYYQQEKKPALLWDLYPLPNEKFDANNGIRKQFSMGLIGGGNAWCEADQAGRKAIWEAHRQYTLEMYQFLTTDPAVPPELRARLAEYGLCKDEFPDYEHWSPQLYVREGRRLRGAYVLTQADILTNRQKSDPIAIGSFPIDSHDCQRLVKPNGEVVNEGTIFPVHVPETTHGPAHQIPYRSIVPHSNDCTNLLVPVALSATHVAYCSIRVEPTWMAIGQGAGIAAALAAKVRSTVQGVPFGSLKERLVAQGQVVDLP